MFREEERKRSAKMMEGGMNQKWDLSKKTQNKTKVSVRKFFQYVCCHRGLTRVQSPPSE